MLVSSRRAPRLAIIPFGAKAIGLKNLCGIYPMPLKYGNKRSATRIVYLGTLGRPSSLSRRARRISNEEFAFLSSY